MKLTIKLEKELASQIEEFAKEKKVDVASLITAYLKQLVSRKETYADISPKVAELMGIISEEDLSMAMEERERYLKKKNA